MKKIADSLLEDIRTVMASKLTYLIMGFLILLAVASHADVVTLPYGQCQDFLNATNETVTVCAQAYPQLNEVVELGYSDVYQNNPLNLTVIAPPFLPCPTCNTTQDCPFCNTSSTCPSQTVCPQLQTVEALIAYNQTRSWENVSRITVTGPAVCPATNSTCLTCPATNSTCSTCTVTNNCPLDTNCTNTTVSQFINYEQVFRVDQPGCHVEAIGPSMPNMTCPSIPACPTITCPTCPECPKQPECGNTTVLKEITVDSCQLPSTNISDCKEAFKIGDEMYCRDSLEKFSAYILNKTIGAISADNKRLTERNSVLEQVLAYYQSGGNWIEIILILIAIFFIIAIGYFVYMTKIQRGYAPVQEQTRGIPVLPAQSIGPPKEPIKQLESKKKGGEPSG